MRSKIQKTVRGGCTARMPSWGVILVAIHSQEFLDGMVDDATDCPRAMRRGRTGAAVPHSERSAVMGSMCVARLAGKYPQRSPRLVLLGHKNRNENSCLEQGVF